MFPFRNRQTGGIFPRRSLSVEVRSNFYAFHASCLSSDAAARLERSGASETWQAGTFPNWTRTRSGRHFFTRWKVDGVFIQ